MSQKIVIPKGLINPNETTIIEIPDEVKHIETVIAKPIHEKKKPRESGDQNKDMPEETANLDYIQQPKMRQKFSLYNPSYTPSVHVNSDSSICKQTSSSTQNMETKAKEDEKPSKTTNVPIVPMRDNIRSEDISAVLDAMEKTEFHKLYKNLREYQAARRKMLFEASNLDTLEDISYTLRSMNKM